MLINTTPLGRMRKSSGFTLIELMVSIAMGLLIVTGMVSMYSNISRANSEMAKANGIIENGRLAVDVVAEDIAHAGFWNGFVPDFDDLTATVAPTDFPTASPDPCLAFSSANWTTGYKNNLIGQPVQVFSAVPAGCNSLLTNKLANTDVVVVRRANNCAVGEANCEADNAAKLYLQTSLCSSEIATGSRYVLNNSGFGLRVRGCVTPAPTPETVALAPKRKFISNIYYIRDYANTVGDGIPTLMRSSFDVVGGVPEHSRPAALIEGIQGFSVELGLDMVSRCATAANYTTAPSKVDPASCTVNTTNPDFNTAATNRGDGVPEPPFVRCAGAGGCTSTQLVNVVAAKIYVLARSREPALGYTDTKTYKLGSTTLPAFNDGFKRHVFQLTTRINNVSARRESP